MDGKSSGSHFHASYRRGLVQFLMALRAKYYGALVFIANQRTNTFIGKNLKERSMGHTAINNMSTCDAMFYRIEGAAYFWQHAALKC